MHGLAGGGHATGGNLRLGESRRCACSDLGLVRRMGADAKRTLSGVEGCGVLACTCDGSPYQGDPSRWVHNGETLPKRWLLARQRHGGELKWHGPAHQGQRPQEASRQAWAPSLSEKGADVWKAMKMDKFEVTEALRAARRDALSSGRRWWHAGCQKPGGGAGQAERDRWAASRASWVGDTDGHVPAPINKRDRTQGHARGAGGGCEQGTCGRGRAPLRSACRGAENRKRQEDARLSAREEWPWRRRPWRRRWPRANDGS